MAKDRVWYKTQTLSLKIIYKEMKKYNLFVLLVIFLVSLVQTNSINAQAVTKLEPIESLALKGEKSLYEIGGLVTLENNKLVVSDKPVYKTYLIGDLNTLLEQTGARGKGPAEFSAAPSKIAFDKINQKIAVLDLTKSYINIYNNSLKFTNRITSKFPPSDIAYDDQGNLLVGATPTKGYNNSIYIYDENNLVKSFDVELDYINMVFDIFFIDYLKKSQKIVVVYQNRNLIQLYNLEGSLISETNIKDLPKLSDFKEVNRARIKKLPTSDIFKSIATDEEKIFILGSTNSEVPDRTIYVLSKRGTLLNKLILNRPMNIIAVVDGFLYAANENSIEKYSL